MKIDDAKFRNPSVGIHRKKEESVTNSRFSLYSSHGKEDLSYVDIDKIIPFKNQARLSFGEEEIQSLAKSIKEYGLRSPLTLIRSENSGMFEVLSGERRLRACKLIGLKKVAAFILETNEKAECLALIENIQREDLHPIEFGKACKEIFDKKIYKSTQQLGDELGIPRSKIAESLYLLSLPESIQEYLIKNKVSNRELLRRLTKAKNLEECNQIIGIGKDGRPKKITESIVRFFLRDGTVMVQKNKIRNLTKTEKEDLIKNVEAFLISLS